MSEAICTCYTCVDLKGNDVPTLSRTCPIHLAEATAFYAEYDAKCAEAAERTKTTRVGNPRTQERCTLLVFANQYFALQKWVRHTVPTWTQEVQCCMDDCERTANRIIDYLDGKIEHLNPAIERRVCPCCNDTREVHRKELTPRGHEISVTDECPACCEKRK